MENLLQRLQAETSVMNSDEKEEYYWKLYIEILFIQNEHLYAEFVSTKDGLITFDYDSGCVRPTFVTGYVLPYINKNKLFRLIKMFMNEKRKDAQYFVSTRPKHSSYKEYYIVISILNMPIQISVDNVELPIAEIVN